MGVALDSSLNKYAQAAGVSADVLNNKDKGKAQDAADKVLAQVAQDSGASKSTIKAALEMDAKAYHANNKSDKFSAFSSHVASDTNNNATITADLAAEATADGVGNNTAMANFITALGNSVKSGMSSAVTTDGKSGKHDDQTTTINAGGYNIEYSQVDDAYNSLKVTTDDGTSISVPSDMAKGGAGTFKLPNGAVINVGDGGSKASFSVTYGGQTQSVQYDGIKDGHGQNTVSMSGAGSTGSGGAASTNSAGAPVDAQGRQSVSPMFVMNAESSMAQAYGVNPDILSSAVVSTWADPTATCPAKLKGKDAEAWQLGHQFAMQFNNQGSAQPTTFSLASMPSGWQGQTAFNTKGGGVPTASSLSASSANTASGAANGPLTFDASKQNANVTPAWVNNAMNTLSESWGKNGDEFEKGIDDAWSAQGGSNPDPPNFAGMSPTKSAAYMAGWQFAEAYRGGSKSGSSDVTSSQISAFGPTTGVVSSSSNTSSGSMPSFDASNQNSQVTPQWVANAMNTISKSWGKSGDEAEQGMEDAWNVQGGGGNVTPPDFSKMSATQSQAYMAGWKFAEAYRGGVSSGDDTVTSSQISAFEKGGNA